MQLNFQKNRFKLVIHASAIAWNSTLFGEIWDTFGSGENSEYKICWQFEKLISYTLCCSVSISINFSSFSKIRNSTLLSLRDEISEAFTQISVPASLPASLQNVHTNYLYQYISESSAAGHTETRREKETASTACEAECAVIIIPWKLIFHKHLLQFLVFFLYFTLFCFRCAIHPFMVCLWNEKRGLSDFPSVTAAAAVVVLGATFPPLFAAPAWFARSFPFFLGINHRLFVSCQKSLPSFSIQRLILIYTFKWWVLICLALSNRQECETRSKKEGIKELNRGG